MFQIVEASMNYIYLNAKELAERLDCEPETVVRNKKFLEGIHFVFPPGSNRKRFIWDNIERDMLRPLPVSLRGAVQRWLDRTA